MNVLSPWHDSSSRLYVILKVNHIQELLPYYHVTVAINHVLAATETKVTTFFLCLCFRCSCSQLSVYFMTGNACNTFWIQYSYLVAYRLSKDLNSRREKEKTRFHFYCYWNSFWTPNPTLRPFITTIVQNKREREWEKGKAMHPFLED